MREGAGRIQHAFIGVPRGLGGPTDLDRHLRVVLADAPFLAMRLHQAGVAGVALAEDPAVLPPLRDWLVGRDLVVAGYRRCGIDALVETLGTLGLRAQDANSWG